MIFYDLMHFELSSFVNSKVSSESGWSPGPAWANRMFKKTNYGWFPVEEAFSLCE